MSNKKELPTANSVLNKINRNVFALQRSEALEAMEEYALLKCEALKGDFVSNPKKYLPKLCEALGVEMVENMLLKEENEKLRNGLDLVINKVLRLCEVDYDDDAISYPLNIAKQALNKEG